MATGRRRTTRPPADPRSCGPVARCWFRPWSWVCFGSSGLGFAAVSRVKCQQHGVGEDIFMAGTGEVEKAFRQQEGHQQKPQRRRITIDAAGQSQQCHKEQSGHNDRCRQLHRAAADLPPRAASTRRRWYKPARARPCSRRRHCRPAIARGCERGCGHPRPARNSWQIRPAMGPEGRNWCRVPSNLLWLSRILAIPMRRPATPRMQNAEGRPVLRSSTAEGGRQKAEVPLPPQAAALAAQSQIANRKSQILLADGRIAGAGDDGPLLAGDAI